MNRIIENLKVNNPAIYQILQEQEKHSIEYNIKSKPNQLCQHGVKY